MDIGGRLCSLSELLVSVVNMYLSLVDTENLGLELSGLEILQRF